MTEKPAIVLRHTGYVDPAVLREVCAGAEEEGVPTRVEQVRDTDLLALAHAAALESSLETGIGIDGSGAVAVHHASLPADEPVQRVEAGSPRPDLRIAGRTAARIVKVLPLS
ncbi:glycerol dehydratase reactivase beta/small subunit family protein [Pseudonocardia kujensis]|uniref:glycerol dehydratase reactivase beta/small subunit family protein n=1 Tax=Pseudonocardia kujensis TaxID=1128675 RepID=UPI001E5D46DA|nr:glycerol dehydratase reactivase beta/small subunit family protein [Pseudonocardia kujensis]MCE0765207.1 glycerol dehydratase reactivase beta/small subunit family protein [Pseudonocardia kujensis]